MINREYWPPAVIARSLEKFVFSQKPECSFDLSKNKYIILIPGMGAPVSQLFELVDSLRKDHSFQEYGVTAVEMGLSLGDFSITLQTLINKVEQKLLSKTKVSELVLYAHSHGGRFASELATHLQKRHSALELIVITGGTPICERPQSIRNWLFSLSFRHWPHINQPQLEKYFALYSATDEIVDVEQATTASQARLIELEDFCHEDFIKPTKVIPKLKKLLSQGTITTYPTITKIYLYLRNIVAPVRKIL